MTDMWTLTLASDQWSGLLGWPLPQRTITADDWNDPAPYPMLELIAWEAIMRGAL